MDDDVFGKDGIHGGIGRFQSDTGGFFIVAFKCGKAIFKHGNNNLAVSGFISFFDNDIVTVHDLSFDHAFSPNLENVDTFFAGYKTGGDADSSVRICVGFNGGAGGDKSQNRDFKFTLSGKINIGIHKLDRAVFARASFDETFVFKSFQMFVNSSQGTDANAIRDLSKGGSVAISLNMLADKFHDLLLTFVNDGGHSIKLQTKPESVKWESVKAVFAENRLHGEWLDSGAGLFGILNETLKFGHFIWGDAPFFA